MSARLVIFCGFTAFACCRLAIGEERLREWTGADGKTKVIAELVWVKADETAGFRYANGSEFTTSISQLWSEDQDLVRRCLERADHGAGSGTRSIERGIKIAARPHHEPRKWFLGIGVDEYTLDRRIASLRFCGNDARELAAAFKALRYDVVTWLSDDSRDATLRPKRRNILSQLDALFGVIDSDGKHVAPGAVGPQDTVVVAFSGHGMFLNGQGYICPSDAKIDDPKTTMLSVSEIYEQLARSPAKTKVLFVDACRNDPGAAARGADGRAIEVEAKLATIFGQNREGIVTLSSCAAGEKALEDKELEHGIFTYYLVKGLNGSAAEKGHIKLLKLFAFVSEQVKDYSLKKHQRIQQPKLSANDISDVSLGTLAANSPEEAGTGTGGAEEEGPEEEGQVEPQRTTPLNEQLGRFGQVPPKWKQVGDITNDHFEIERGGISIAGDFTVRLTVTVGRADRNGFRLTLVGANGSSDVVVEGGKTNSWSGVDTWSFLTPKGKCDKGLTPQNATLILQRKGAVFEFSAAAVFNPQSHSPEIGTFVVSGAKNFDAIRIATDGPGIMIQRLQVN